MKIYHLVFLLVAGVNLFSPNQVLGYQGDQPAVDTLLMASYEDSLKTIASHMMGDLDPEDRKKALKQFKPLFEEALAVPNSYLYPFDSLQTISIVTAPDDAFRTITWQLCINSDEFEYHGYIQMNAPELQIAELEDESEDARSPELDILDADSWYGSLYYNIHKVGKGDNAYYLLFGFDANQLYLRRKLIDVLSFEDGEPVFGKQVFNIEEPGQLPRTVNRFILEYSSSSTIRLNFDEEYNMILFDHLIEVGGLYNNEGIVSVPDGSYRGFELKNGQWHWVEKVFDDFQEEAPRPFPILGKDKPGLFGPAKEDNQ